MPEEQDDSEPQPDCWRCGSIEHTGDDHPCDVCGMEGCAPFEHPYCGVCDEYGCDGCGYADDDGYSDDDLEDLGIHDYNWQPSVLLYSDVSDTGECITLEQASASGGHMAHSYPDPPSTAPFLGLEVEVEAVHCGMGDLATIWNDSGLGWVKTDGSLTDQGVECVTHPTTGDRLEHDGILVDVLRAMGKAGGRAWGPGHCGLHIHISRPSFKDRAHQWRFAAAHEALQHELQILSGREEHHYCKWQGALTEAIPSRQYAGPLPASPREPSLALDHPSYDAAWLEWQVAYDTWYTATRAVRRERENGSSRHAEDQKATKIIAGKQMNNDRYVSVNVTSGTIELRFWRGSLAPDHVMGAVAMADAMQAWTRTMTFRQVRDGMTWDGFQVWALANLPKSRLRRIRKLADRRGVVLHEDIVIATNEYEEVNV